jgi:hypothetical protein
MAVARPDRDPPRRADDDVLVADGEPRVVLVDERLSVQAERLGVRAEEPLDVRRRRKEVESLVLERSQVLRPDLRPLLELGEVELLARPGVAKAGTDVEHARGSVRAKPVGSRFG